VLTPHRRSGIYRVGGALLAALSFWAAGSVQPAAAQSLFEALFGGAPRFARPEPLPPQASSYADPLGLTGRDSRRPSSDSYSRYGGHGTAYCVRTCDGRYFPMQHHAGASPAEQCRSFCPASKTMVFSGGKIDYAVAPNGTRYADLDNAFAYRDHYIANCTCNGKDGLGLAHLNANSDPTLRPGDIVVTNAGFVSFRGKSAKNAKNAKDAKDAQFTPINPSSSAWARQLSEIKIRPAPPASAATIAPPTDKHAAEVARKELRRAQLNR
jgi:hypothetical protein